MCLCEADGNGITERKCKQGKETLEIRRPDMKETTRKARQSIQLLLLLLTFFTLNLVSFPMSANNAAKDAQGQHDQEHRGKSMVAPPLPQHYQPYLE